MFPTNLPSKQIDSLSQAVVRIHRSLEEEPPSIGQLSRLGEDFHCQKRSLNCLRLFEKGNEIFEIRHSGGRCCNGQKHEDRGKLVGQILDLL